MKLFKILSIENWLESQCKQELVLPDFDAQFIHLATEEQLERILKKFWANRIDYLILELDADRLVGKLVLENNPGGTTKYYHLYSGKIPLAAISGTRHPSI